MATIKIDTERVIGEIDQRVYGDFVENMFCCVYGGLFDEGSPLSDERGFRRDVLEALRPLHLAVVRGPGGNFVSGYHWIDGVGPVERRPRRVELAWHAEESNRFGVNEFLQYCEQLSAEPYQCVNLGSGTLDEARALVEYCNGTGNTYWANLRRLHGHVEPYHVKYWGLGNEMYGEWQIGALSAEDYCKKAREFAKVMKWTDPSIHLISCDMYGFDDWDRIVLEALAPISISTACTCIQEARTTTAVFLLRTRRNGRCVSARQLLNRCVMNSTSSTRLLSPRTNGTSGIARSPARRQ